MRELLDGKSTQQIVNKGLNFFMQGGRIFPHLTVEENLNFAGMGFSKKEFRVRKEEVTSFFDLFKNAGNGKLKMEASYLSGGEQHQLALAMVLMKKPKLLILDEPSAGISPGNVRQVYEILEMIKKEQNISFLIIAQNINSAFEFRDRIVLLSEIKIERQKLFNNLNTTQKIDNFFRNFK